MRSVLAAGVLLLLPSCGGSKKKDAEKQDAERRVKAIELVPELKADLEHQRAQADERRRKLKSVIEGR